MHVTVSPVIEEEQQDVAQGVSHNDNNSCILRGLLRGRADPTDAHPGKTSRLSCYPGLEKSSGPIAQPCLPGTDLTCSCRDRAELTLCPCIAVARENAVTVICTLPLYLPLLQDSA